MMAINTAVLISPVVNYFLLAKVHFGFKKCHNWSRIHDLLVGVE